MATKKLDHQRNKKKRVMSAIKARKDEFPTSHWAHAVAMLAEQTKLAVAGSQNQQFDDSSADGLDIIGVRRLASQI